MMIRTTLMIPSNLKAHALQEAHKIGVSLGEFIRECVEEKLKTSILNKADPLLSDRVLFAGKTPRNLAAKHDDYLYEN